jgi:SAM-dependent methyltransferase
VTEAKGAREVFQRIYELSHWEGGSGQGSRLNVTQVYRDLVSCLIGSRDVRSVVDAGCGDWEFARLIDWSNVTYLGLDVVPAVIERNRSEFLRSNICFQCVDISDATLPRADLLLCKDVLQHWPTDSVQRFLRRLRTRYRYVLLTNDVQSVHCAHDSLNSAIPLGGWRTLDLERPPFRLRPDWRLDYDIRGEWTKRVILLVSSHYKRRARLDSDSALNRVRRRKCIIEPGG